MSPNSVFVETFTAVDPNTKTIYKINVYQEYKTPTTATGTEYLPSFKTLITTKGEHVNVVDESKGIYRVIHLNEMIDVIRV